MIESQIGVKVSTKVQNGWRFCIDYHKLNVSIRNYHFPVPFINQMLKTLIRRTHYCCLDRYFGFYQILVAPKNQEKNHIHLSLQDFCLQKKSHLSSVTAQPPSRDAWSTSFLILWSRVQKPLWKTSQFMAILLISVLTISQRCWNDVLNLIFC